MTRTLVAAGLTGAWLLVAPATSLAHPSVDQGRAAFEEAEFVSALDAFARAEAADDLSREELAAMLALRAQVHLAMGNPELMRADLGRLAIVAPQHAFDRRANPDVRRAFAEARATSGAIRLRARPRAAAQGVTVVAEAHNDSMSMIREVRVSGRVEGAASWEHAVDGPLLVLTDGDVVEYYAEAIGPGGVPLAAAGSAGAPLRYAGASDTAAGGGSPSGEGSGVDGGWVAFGVIVGLVVAAGVAIPIAFVVSDEGSDQTRVAPFTVRF